MQKYLPWIVAAAVLALALFMYFENRRLIRSIEQITRAEPLSTPRAVEPVPVRETSSMGGTTSPRAQLAQSPSSNPLQGLRLLRGRCLDTDRVPLAGVAIVASVVAPGQTESRRTVSDADGLFAVEWRDGEVLDFLRADRDGYAPVELAHNDLVSTRFVELVLEPLASCELQVFKTRNDGGLDRYVGPATIYVMRRAAPEDNSGMLTSRELSGVPGRFVTIGAEEATITDGRYDLRGYPPAVYKVAIVAGDEYAESEPFSLNRNEKSVATVVLGNRQKFAGRVLSKADQQPVKGARVWLSLQKVPEAHLAKNLTFESSTDHDGRFLFDKVVPSVYVLTIAAEGFTTHVVDEVTVASGDEQGTEHTYYLSATAPALRLQVLGPDGLPAPAKVVLYSIASTPHAAVTKFAETDSSGQTVFDNLLPGRYTLTVSLASDATRQKQQEIVIPERGVQNVNLVFQPTVQVQGTVRLDGREPWNGLVYFVPRGAIGPKKFAKCNLDGSFQVELEPGEYLVGRADQPPTAHLRIYASGNTDLVVNLK